MPVIGIAGGVGSGKSTAARTLGELGCLVSDSDAGAREALQRPEVVCTLVGWWGEGVLSPDGSPDRSAIAKIVFADDAERKRLEALIHPLLRAEREALIAGAAGRGAKAVVIDAPLLFEAGLDAECDAVVFVETPEAVRVERVRETRGWDAGELHRREKAQLPLDAKRERSDYVVVNDGHPDRLRAQLEGVLRAILNPRTG